MNLMSGNAAAGPKAMSDFVVWTIRNLHINGSAFSFSHTLQKKGEQGR
jgi:hypothetical protein